MVKIESVAFRNILILLGFFLTAVFCYGHFVDHDVLQILEKAHILATQGMVIPYGNISSSGASGNIPGAFLTLATGGPMLLWFSPWAALAFLTLLHFLALLMFQNILKDFVAPITLTVLVVLFWLNPWRLSEVFLWNPAYIYFVSLAHMWSAYHLSKKASFVFSVVHGLSLFLGLQVHPSFIILFFVTMILLWAKALKPHIMGTITGILLGLASLIPYVLAGLEDPNILPRPGSGTGEGFLFFGLVYVYPVIKGFWYWILFGSNIFQTHIFHQLDFSWLKNQSLEWGIKNIWLIVKYIIGLFGVGLSFYVNFKFYKSNKEKFNILKYKMRHSKDWLSFYVVAAFLSSVFATAISPSAPIYWHLLYIWPMAIVPLLLMFDHFFKEPQWKKKTTGYLFVLIFYFTLANVFGAMGSKKHDINKSFHDLYFDICKEHCELSNIGK